MAGHELRHRVAIEGRVRHRYGTGTAEGTTQQGTVRRWRATRCNTGYCTGRCKLNRRCGSSYHPNSATFADSCAPRSTPWASITAPRAPDTVPGLPGSIPRVPGTTPRAQGTAPGLPGNSMPWSSSQRRPCDHAKPDSRDDRARPPGPESSRAISRQRDGIDRRIARQYLLPGSRAWFYVVVLHATPYSTCSIVLHCITRYHPCHA